MVAWRWGDGQEEPEGEMTKGRAKIGMMETLISLIVVMVSCVYPYVKTS